MQLSGAGGESIRLLETALRAGLFVFFSPPPLWDELQRVDVARANESEVPVIERG